MPDEKMDVKARPAGDDDVEGHAMRSGPEGLARREGEGLAPRREGEGLARRGGEGASGDDDVEGHSFGLRGGSTRGD